MDLILLAIIVFCVWGGLKSGLIKQLLDLVGVVIALFVAARYGAAFGQKLSGYIDLEKIAARFIVGKTEGGLVSGIVEGAMPKIIGGLQDILGYILLFFLVLGIVKLAALVLGMVFKLPVLGAVDKVGGMVLGLLKGGLIALVTVWILNLLPIPWVMENMESSIVARTLLGVAPGLYKQVFNADKYREIRETPAILEILGVAQPLGWGLIN